MPPLSHTVRRTDEVPVTARGHMMHQSQISGRLPYSPVGCIAIGLTMVHFLAWPVQAVTWHVPSECPTIHAGLDSAFYGDTVLVAPGIYLKTDEPETTIRPGPGVLLVSESGPEATIIEFCNCSTGIVLSDCEGARVSGFTVRFGSGPDCLHPPTTTKGFHCYHCTDVIVEECITQGVDYAILVEGSSSEWWKPVIRNNIILGTGLGIACHDVLEPGRPLIEGNTISGCSRGGEFYSSSPIIDANRITDCGQWGLYFSGNCTGNCTRNTLAYNSGGVYIYADPPLGAPGFNGSWEPLLANDFYGNTGYDIFYEHTEGTGGVMAIYNYWGSRCPDFASKFYGEITYSPWVDSTHTELIYTADCPGATESTTWGAIKAMFR
jgi:hypothetical protein